MVLAYLPQRMKHSLSANTNYSPQGEGVAGDFLLALFPPLADNTFQFYKFYQIKKNQVPTTQTNMPLVIIDTLGPGVIHEDALDEDIRAFDSNGVPLDYEIQEANLVTGFIIVWVNVPVVRDFEFIQLTFGKPTATNGQSTSTWPSGYKMVHHLQSASFDTFLDSTSNGNDGTNFGTTNITGKIGNARSFDGLSNKILIGTSANLNITGNKLYLSAWIKPDVAVAFDVIIGKTDTDGSFGWTLFNFGGLAHCRLDDDTVTSPTSDIVAGVFQKLDAVYDGSTLQLYYNGDLVDSTVKTANLTSRNDIPAIGVREFDTPDSFFEGIIDEPRVIEGGDFSAAFIKTAFNNENDNDVFWFKTPLLENGVNNFLVDDQGRRLVAVGQ